MEHIRSKSKAVHVADAHGEGMGTYGEEVADQIVGLVLDHAGVEALDRAVDGRTVLAEVWRSL